MSTTFTSRITDANGGEVGNQLHAVKQQMPPRDSLAAQDARTRRDLAHSRRPAHAIVFVRPGEPINMALNLLKKRLLGGGVLGLITKRKFSPLYNAMSRGQKRRRKDALAHKRRMKNISRARRFGGDDRDE